MAPHNPIRGGDGTGAVREGCALLQGLAVCGVCGRKLGVFYRGGTKPAPGYQCNGGVLVGGGQGRRCTRVSGLRADAAVAEHVLTALTPLAMQACLAAADRLQSDRDTALDQWRRQAEQARYTATTAERRYRAVDPDNRLVARSLEADWETALTAAATADAELARRQAARPIELTSTERSTITTLGADLNLVWAAPTTTDRDRKELLHTLLDEVVITVDDHDNPDRSNSQPRQAHLLLRFKGGLTSQIHTDLPAQKPPYRTDEDTLALIGRLVVHYDDSMIAKILNQQHRRTARGLSYTAANVATIRRRWDLPTPTRCAKASTPAEEPVSMSEAARQLGVTPSTVYRWINDGLVPAEQLTPGAPWRIRMTNHIRALVAENAPDGWVPVQVATRTLGISRPTLLQRVKRGELRAVHIRAGRKKSLRIELPTPQDGLF